MKFNTKLDGSCSWKQQSGLKW